MGEASVFWGLGFLFVKNLQAKHPRTEKYHKQKQSSVRLVPVDLHVWMVETLVSRKMSWFCVDSVELSMCNTE